MALKCDKCGEVKDTSELAKWNLDGEVICWACYNETLKAETVS